MEVSEQTFTKLFALLELDVLSNLSFNTLNDRFITILNSLSSEKEKDALCYTLWQLYIEFRWTRTIMSRIAIIYLLYTHSNRLPEHAKIVIDNSYLQAYLETSDKYSDNERILMARLVLNEGHLLPECLSRTFDQGLLLQIIECDDNDRIVNAYENVQRKLSNESLLQKGTYAAVIASSENFHIDESVKIQTKFKQLRLAYFLRIGGRHGPMYRTFTPEVIHVTPGIFDFQKEMGLLLPGIFDFTNLLWDNTLDDLVCDVPQSRYILEISTLRTLELDEHQDLMAWIANVLGPIDKIKLLYRAPRLFKKFGLTPSMFVDMASYNPNTAADILKHAVHQYDMSSYFLELITSLANLSQSKRNPTMLANRFEAIKQLFMFASMPIDYATQFFTNSIELCKQFPELDDKIGRKICVLILNIVETNTTHKTTQSDIQAVNSLWDRIETFCVNLRGINEAQKLYELAKFNIKSAKGQVKKTVEKLIIYETEERGQETEPADNPSTVDVSLSISEEVVAESGTTKKKRKKKKKKKVGAETPAETPL